MNEMNEPRRLNQKIIRSAVLSATVLLTAACGSDESLTSREIVTTVLEQGLAGGDKDIITQYVREDYIQHSALAPDGRAGLLAAVDALAGITVEIHRVLVDGDQVATHSTYTFPDGSQQVAFDVFRLEDGLLAEHWDALQPLQTETASGRSMVDGPTLPSETADTEANRTLVKGFVDAVLVGGNFDVAADFISTTSYAQHNPSVADGLEGIGAFVGGLAENGIGFGYTRSPLVVAQGDFVLVGSEGFFGPLDTRPFALFYDLFRVEDGKIVEHWDVIPSPAPDPAQLPHDNGLF